jgi:hypothetical protein
MPLSLSLSLSLPLSQRQQRNTSSKTGRQPSQPSQHRRPTMSNNPKPLTFSLSSIYPDVEIFVFQEVYHVHSFLLRQFSDFFQASLSSRWWKEENTMSNGTSIKYCCHLVLDNSGDGFLEPLGPGIRVGSP